jgi:LuxR family transcriptional regulator, quorum-sensing system regulator CciR
MFERVGAFVDDVSAARTQEELRAILAEITTQLGFAHFALTHHVDLLNSSEPAIRIHNYPAEWECYYDRKQLGRTDPVHRACQTTAVGFTWSQLPRMIPLTRMDRAVLEAAAKQGLGNGYTVPAHVPGEVNGSCSFATARGRPLQAESLAAAQLVGAFAFEAARRLVKRDHKRSMDPARFSDRERDCLIWVARGKSDSEIATILGISPETVHQYVKQARANYDAVSRSQLVAHALFSGTISFMDIFKR